jgi:predicted ATPase/class 3 adenylate cyclase
MNCPNCDTSNITSANFCVHCGRALASVERPRSFVQWLQSNTKDEPERRQVTILACDTVGSSLLAEQMDPEEFLDLMNRMFDTILSPIFNYGGYLARLEGDGFKAFFGAPESHEDDPLRAVQAGLEIQVAARRLAVQFAEEENVSGFAVRVGVHTDHVVVGPVGTKDVVEYTAMGIGIVLATRLESIARPGTVLISQATYRLVKPYVEVVPLGPTKVKGRTEPVRVFEVTGLHSPIDVDQALSVHSPLVNRKVELAILRKAVTGLVKDARGLDLTESPGNIVLIVGEAGVGKSRLVNHAHDELTKAHPELIWLKGRALTQGQGAFGVLADLLRRYLGISADDRMADMMSKLRHRITQLFPASPQTARLGSERSEEAEELIPHLANLLSLHLEGEAAQRINNLDPEGQERQMFRTLRRLFERLSRDGPLVLALDDLQWVDDGSIRLITDLMHLTDEHPILLMFSFRPEAEAACLHLRNIARRDYTRNSTELLLHGLSPAASDELIENLIKSPSEEDLPEHIRALIRDRSGGNPLFIEEVVRSLIDRQVLEHSNGRWQVIDDVPANYIPETLHGVIAARLDRLDPQSRHTLQVAAVIGRTFSSRILEAIIHDNSHLSRHLAHLQQAELIRERRRGVEQEYVFTHTLTQQLAYETLLRRQRRDYHRRVAQRIEELYTDRLEEHFERLAYHFASAEMWRQALSYHIKFARQAQLRYANSKAAKHYHLAWEIVKSEQAGDRDERRMLHEGQADLDLLAGQYQRAVFRYQAALELSNDPPEQTRLLRKLGNLCQRWGKYEQGITYLEQGLEIAASTGAGSELAALYAGLGQIYYRLDKFEQAAELGLRALEVFEQRDDRSGIALASNLLGIIYWAMGDLETARTFHEKSLLSHASLGDVNGLAASYNNLGRVLADQGQLERALSNYHHSQRLCTEIGHQHGLATALNNMSELYQQLGQHEEAWACQEQAFEIYNRIGFDGLSMQPEVLKMQVW